MQITKTNSDLDEKFMKLFEIELKNLQAKGWTVDEEALLREIAYKIGYMPAE